MKLKLGQNIYIDNEKYKIISVIECEEDIFFDGHKSIERYEILSIDNKTILWLIIEIAYPENDKYYIFEECEINNKTYNLYKKQQQYQEYSDMHMKIVKSCGKITSYAGDRYSLKQFKSGQKRIFIEKTDHRYVYYGNILEENRIYVTDEINKEIVINGDNTKNIILEFLRRLSYLTVGIMSIGAIIFMIVIYNME